MKDPPGQSSCTGLKPAFSTASHNALGEGCLVSCGVIVAVWVEKAGESGPAVAQLAVRIGCTCPESVTVGPQP